MTNTPYYIYDTQLFRKTIETALKEAATIPNSHIHFAIKSNSNTTLLNIAAELGLGADCVSGREILHAVESGIKPQDIMFAGVGKTDWEINAALDSGIGCFNVESVPELDIINALAKEKGVVAPVAFRINPNVDAHTHQNITTGLEENKFGISMDDMIPVILHAKELSNVSYRGLHFHIGSQVLEFTCFKNLAQRINQLQDKLESAGITDTRTINVGGGLGIDYQEPEKNPIPDFKGYFAAYRQNIKLREGQSLHFELGRALCGQCGELITRCIFVKKSAKKQFAIVDSGFTDLIRPALYDAHHKIVNLTGDAQQRPKEIYDVVGPICESSDVFDKDIQLSQVKRGDLLSIKSAGAYGYVMASTYNLRLLPQEVIK